MRTAPSAHKWGYEDGEIMHIYTNAHAKYAENRDDQVWTMHVGFDYAANECEVGVIDGEVIIHCMKITDATRRRLRKQRRQGSVPKIGMTTQEVIDNSEELERLMVQDWEDGKFTQVY